MRVHTYIRLSMNTYNFGPATSKIFTCIQNCDKMQREERSGMAPSLCGKRKSAAVQAGREKGGYPVGLTSVIRRPTQFQVKVLVFRRVCMDQRKREKLVAMATWRNDRVINADGTRGVRRTPSTSIGVRSRQTRLAGWLGADGMNRGRWRRNAAVISSPLSILLDIHRLDPPEPRHLYYDVDGTYTSCARLSIT